MDALSALVQHAAPKANLFFSGNLCGSSESASHGQGGQLHLLKSGELNVYESHGRKHVLTEPTLIFYPKGRRHSIQSRTLQGCDLVCATVSFQDSPLLRAMPEVVVIPLSELTHLESVLSLLFDEAFSQRYGYVASIAHLLDLLLILLIRHLVAENICQAGVLAALAHPRLASSLEVMHNQMDHPWTIESLAREAGMSRARFAAVFQQTLGQPPLTYLTEVRLLKAQQLLLSGQAIKSVALEVGYSGSVAFTRAFSRCFDITPAKWLALQQAQAHTSPTE
ncbi:AraC family transcriptional regulator [Vibrio sp. 03_296]|uniref:cupin domain-containing protein n=1 Tax=Vibrio TaxID=662 RepID=UPI000BD5ACA9|nr:MULTISPECIES: cupin domain-containing protein [Vibrio]OZT82756.1 AraC family transcriptional regulator [Vibrio sp. 03_296]PJO13016.1 AraC family transcriptional regulator [Vibrio vulnificus]